MTKVNETLRGDCEKIFFNEQIPKKEKKKKHEKNVERNEKKNYFLPDMGRHGDDFLRNVLAFIEKIKMFALFGKKDFFFNFSDFIRLPNE